MTEAEDKELILLLVMVRKLCPQNEEPIIKMILDEVAGGRLPISTLLKAEQWRPRGVSIHVFPKDSTDIGLVISIPGSEPSDDPRFFDQVIKSGEAGLS